MERGRGGEVEEVMKVSQVLVRGLPVLQESEWAQWLDLFNLKRLRCEGTYQDCLCQLGF